MFLWLLDESGTLSDRIASAASGDSRILLTLRIVAAAVTAFLTALLFGGPVIRWLGRRFRERVHSASQRLDALHSSKNATPTMGGLFVVAAIGISSILWGNLRDELAMLSLATVAGFCAIGVVDDWIKLFHVRRGLTAGQKLLAQSVIAAGVGAMLFRHLGDVPDGLALRSPIGSWSLWLGAAFPVWAALIVVGSSNAVNLTDGLDGLAGGCAVLTAGAIAALCYVAGNAVWTDYLDVPFVPGAGETAVVLGALAGAMLGFLWFNCHPAQVFLGDSGSLPIGALLGIGALVARQEALLAVAGGVFVIETLSVMAQIGWFRLTGRRLIACSPLHNHFVLSGHQEPKIVVRFWIGSALCVAMAFALLKVR